MSARTVLFLAAAATVSAACAAPGPPARPWPDPSVVRDAPLAAGKPFVAVDFPAPDSVYGDAAPAYVAGTALALDGGAPFDVILVLDVSGSTMQSASGSGPTPALLPMLGRPPRNAAPEGSILSVQVAAARALVSVLDPRIARVGIVTFSGSQRSLLGMTFRNSPDPRKTRPAAAGQGSRDGSFSRQGRNSPSRTAVPLTRDRAALDAAFEDILERGPWGLTHMAAGLEHAIAELVGGPFGKSAFDLRTRKVIVFMTDGTPTLPHPGDLRENQDSVLTQIDRAAAYGIRIHSYGIGAEALKGPLPLVEMALRTGGSFVPVRNPRLLPRLLPALQLGDLEALAVRNRTTGDDAVATVLHPDGRWDALVSLDPGRNEIEIRARTKDGAEGEAHLPLIRRLDIPGSELPPELAGRRAALEAEAVARREALRLELEAEIARERETLQLRIDAQRKELELAPDEAAAP